MNSKHFEKIGRILRGLTAGCALALLASACVTTPTSSSSSSGGMPGTPGSTGMPSPSGTGGLPGTSPAPTTQPGMSTGQLPGATGTGRSDDLAGGTKPGGAEPGEADTEQRSPAKPGQSGAKTDDEILAEALEEFDRRKAQSDQEGEAGTGKAAAGQAPDSVTGRPLTDTEQTAMLKNELDDKYAKFDQVMLNERELVTKQDNEEGNRGFREEDDALGSGEDLGEEAGSDEGLEAGLNSQRGVSGIPGAAQGRPSEKPPTYPDPPPDLASADGDDIIARQLREAAMNEPDPELREKLWDEYRKYKRGQK